MLATQSTGLQFMTYEALRELVRSPGPCITILLPSTRPGGVGGCSDARMRSYLQRAENELIQQGLSEIEVADLLAPLRASAKTPGLSEGSQWARVLFRSPAVSKSFDLIEPVEAALILGNCFSLRGMAVEIRHPKEFCVLHVSKTGVNLFRCADLKVEPIPLALGAPASIAAALGFDAPDHDLENRSAAGTSTGAMGKVRFGNSAENRHAYLEEYYRLVDRELRKLLGHRNLPLILMGVDEETALYRSISDHENLAKGTLPGGDSAHNPTLMLHKAYALFKEEETQRQAATARTERERVSPNRFSTDINALVEAAFAGRVAELYLDRNSQVVEEYNNPSYRSMGDEDLLNLAAVQTILHGGGVYELPTSDMPTRSAVAGTLRF